MGTGTLPATEFLDPFIQGPRSVKAAVHIGPPLFFTFNPAPLSAYFSFHLAERRKPRPSIFAFETGPPIVSKRYDWFIIETCILQGSAIFRPNGETENDQKFFKVQ